MQSFWEIVVSNSLLVVALGVGVTLLGRVWKNPVGLHFLWLLVLLKLVTPPLVTVSVPLPVQARTQTAAVEPAHQVAVQPSPINNAARETMPAAAEPSDRQRIEGPAQPAEAAPQISGEALAARARGIPWLTVLAWCWGVGTAVFAIGQAYRVFRFRTLLRGGQPASPAMLSMSEGIARRLGLRRVPPIRLLPLRISPLVWSLGGRPQVFLPIELFDRLDRAAQEAILAHELAHVRRKDHWVRLFELVITTLFWWHLMVWWARRQLQELEDQCCDAMVVGLTPHYARSYATALVDTLDFLSERSVATPLGATAAKSSVSLTRRIAMLKNRSWGARLTFGRLLLLLTVVAIPMAVAFGQKATDAIDKTPSSKTPSTPAASTAQPAAFGLPRVMIDRTDVYVPQDSELVRRLTKGYVILSEAEYRTLTKEALRLATHPIVETDLGQPVSMMRGSKPLRCQILLPRDEPNGVIALQIWPDVLLPGQSDAASTALKSRAPIRAELKRGEWVAYVDREDASNDFHDAKPVTTLFLVQATYVAGRGRVPAPAAAAGPGHDAIATHVARPPETNSQAVQRRAVNKLVKDFPEKPDLSTPESASATLHRAFGNPDPKSWLDLSAWKYSPRDVADIKREMESNKDELAKTDEAYRNAEIIEVLTYRDGLAEVISKLDLPKGGRNPYSARTFVRINGQWKNFGENRMASVEDAKKDFDRKKDNLWESYVKVLDGIKTGKLVPLHGEPAKRAAQIAPGEPLGIDVEKADLMGRIEWAFMHGARDVTARKSIEWGDVEKDKNGNRTIRYKFEATIWGKDVIIANQVFTFDAKGNILSTEDVEGFPQKKVQKPIDVTTKEGMKERVEDFFSKNFHDVTSRETIEWGDVIKADNGNSSIRYKYRAKIWDKDTMIMNQVFTFDPKGEFVSYKNIEGFPQQP